MGTPNKQNNLLVKSPKYSIFDISSDHKLSMPLGRIVPIGSGYEMMPGDEIDINLQQLTRFMPMLAPVLQRYILDFIPVFVPYRLLWSEDAPIWNANKFFNPATPDTDRPAIPMTSWKQLFTNSSNSVIGSLFDYLGYPTQTGLYNSFIGRDVNYGTTGTPSWKPFSNIFDWANRDTSFYVNFTYLGSVRNIQFVNNNSGTAINFYHWLSVKYSNGSISFSDYSNSDDFIKALSGDLRMPKLQDDYINYMFNIISVTLTTQANKDLSLIPWLVYHKAVSDWFIRTDMLDAESYMLVISNLCHLLSTGTTTLSSYTGYQSSPATALIKSGLCLPRLWMDDYFTTAMTSQQSGTAVAIPVNGTIQQLWTANRLEQFRMRIQLAGKRFIDQIYQLFGVKVPDARLQRTEILGHLKYNLVVSDVMQTSASDIDSSLGQFGGTAISSNGNHLLHYRADEPGYIMILATVRPTSSYVDSTARIFFKKDYYDFENPMFDNVGVQAIMNNELCYRPGDTSVFGYAPRRYAEYMTGHSTISGQMKTTMDYWHAGRKFDLTTSVPALNNDFISMDAADDLDRIFASQSGDNIVMQVYLDSRVTRPLSRFVNYHM